MRKTPGAWAVMFLVLVASGLVISSVKAKSTAPLLVKARLDDIHPLYGGRAIEIGADGCGWVKEVSLGGKKTKQYAAYVAPADMQALLHLVEQHDFFRMKTNDRMGKPDEARPAITVEWQGQAPRTVRKWDDDPHPGFEAIYQWLQGVSDRAIKEPPPRTACPGQVPS